MCVEVKGELGCTVDSFQNIGVPRKYVEKVKSMHLCNLCHVLQKKNNVNTIFECLKS